MREDEGLSVVTVTLNNARIPKIKKSVCSIMTKTLHFSVQHSLIALFQGKIPTAKEMTELSEAMRYVLSCN